MELKKAKVEFCHALIAFVQNGGNAETLAAVINARPESGAKRLRAIARDLRAA